MHRIARVDERSSGVLLHLTSLPGPHGSGDLGPKARAFADWLAAAGQTWWQMLPVVPPGPTASPYDSATSFAGSPWLVSLEDLAGEGLLEQHELVPPHGWPRERAVHGESQAFREAALRGAYRRFRERASRDDQTELDELRRQDWLEGWTSFCALKKRHAGTAWTSWPEALRRRDPDALARARADLADEVGFHEFVQLCFFRQWRALRDHCARRGVALLGDVPMFVAHDSADVWCAPDQFYLDERSMPSAVAGVPPDAFSAMGQLWGNPLYRWDIMLQRGFDWWLDRLSVTLARFDAVRLDHFIGFRRYWEIPFGATDARTGRFIHVPGESLLEAAAQRLGGLPFIAEDLGIVTDEVRALRDHFALPGMRVLQFAFGSEEPNDYRPHRFARNCVVYTGTHDNDTAQGWLRSCDEAERSRVLRYVGASDEDAHWALVRSALLSVANLAIFPLQDVLGLGSEARMNVPGTASGNWHWRALPELLTAECAFRLRTMCHDYERTPRPHEGDAHAFSRTLAG